MSIIASRRCLGDGLDLLPGDGPERIPALLRHSIQEQFGVEVTREAGDLPALLVKSR